MVELTITRLEVGITLTVELTIARLEVGIP